MAGLLIVLAQGAGVKAAQPDGGATDQPAWRATHGVLLAVVRAGSRLIATGDRGTILLSDDGGADWRLTPSGTAELLTSAVFVSPNEGWVVGQDSTILHTTDSGEHWTMQTTAAGGDQALFSIASLGPGHLIATGAYALVLETQDGGHSWTPDKLPNLDEDYHLNCVLPHGQDVLVTGEAGHAFMRHDARWTPIPVPYEGSQFGCLASRTGDLYSFGLRGSLFVSAAAAPAWHRIETGEPRSIFGGTVLADGSFALVGGNGLVMLLDPHTNKLRTLPPPTGATLSGVAERTDGGLVVVGDDGVHLVDPKAAPVGQDVTQ
jgi:photosystem II stability/assembly factor-like uncharacterized protein